MEFVIQGKNVVLNDDIPARAGWGLLTRTTERGKDPKQDFDDAVHELMLFIKSWEFDGDPQDPEAYETLGLFAMTSLRAAVQKVTAGQLEFVKNLISPFTSP